MAQEEGVTLEKLQGGLARLANGTDDHIAYIVIGLPVGAVATAINAAGKGIKLTAPYGAEQIGINESFDANNNLTLYADIVEFFRLAPEATLYLFDKTTKADLKAFINQNKEIKGYGLNIAYDSEAPNLVSTMNAQQIIIEEFALENRLIDFCLVGANNLDVFTEDMFALDCPQVSPIIACSDASGIVRVTAALGMIAIRQINENMGSVDIIKKPRLKRGTEDYTLTDSKLGAWLEAYLPDGRSVNSLDNDEYKAIKALGFIMACSYQEYAGVFFENSYTAVERNSDFGQIENNRTWNKAARITRATLIPKVKGVVKKDPNTGFISPTTVGSWTGLLNKAIEKMVTDNEISGFETYIEQKQVVNSTNPVKVKLTIVADGIVHSFDVAIGLTNNI